MFDVPREFVARVKASGHEPVRERRGQPEEEGGSGEADPDPGPDETRVPLPDEEDTEAWQALAKELGVKSYWLMKPENLRAAVRHAAGYDDAEGTGGAE